MKTDAPDDDDAKEPVENEEPEPLEEGGARMMAEGEPPPEPARMSFTRKRLLRL